jgi:hypothetical protein
MAPVPPVAAQLGIKAQPSASISSREKACGCLARAQAADGVPRLDPRSHSPQPDARTTICQRC